ncbi:glycoside hydrolase family 2 TIM barrel-domain containing protein [Mycolicibacterium porcinum]|uniref:glycoside hydrolase family 2 TIM barrel-domain containing protein n=1 Tax=Mycolicibacterium porcinum TaxID=39693 RepID=UPI000848FF9C|nr:glycoside hydrolase family 2 TIM barrel-domain containing protein [Mycolicibacterium porcinum]ODR17765.1 hypothetical protein BHQ19_28215 [Mycolicibacterium porcinum]
MLHTDFNTDWTVSRNGVEDFGAVTLPHDAMFYEKRDPDTANGPATGFFPGGVYRYRKVFTAPLSWAQRTVVLEFEGVYQRSEIFLNGVRIGGRPSGYALFHVPLHDHVRPGETNVLEVIAHNDEIPNSRWYSGSGIYRPVHLLVGGRVHIAPRGLRIATESIDNGTATLIVTVEIANDTDESHELGLDVHIAGRHGVPVSVTFPAVVVGRRETLTVRHEVAVDDAELWSSQTPHLHRARVRLLDGDGVCDTAEAQFGIRTVHADARRGLLVNGEPVKLRGACIHHDNGVIGAHTLDAAEDRRVRLLKEAGFNAVRSAHNPAAAALLRACDRHGVYVMDELTDVWWQPKSAGDYAADFEAWWERDLESMIAKDVNHPSVIMYSIGNEIADTATEAGIERNRQMADRARALDSSRLVTNGINGLLNLVSRRRVKERVPAPKPQVAPRRRNRLKRLVTQQALIIAMNVMVGAMDGLLPRVTALPAVDRRTRGAFAALDVAGYNYLQARYARDHHTYPDRVIVGTETRPGDTVAIWRDIESMPWVIGDFMWTGWDYIGEAGIGVVSYDSKPAFFHPYPALLAGMPVLDITGHRQVQSYVNEIAWGRSAGPVLSVDPVDHSGQKSNPSGWRPSNAIRSWSWEGCEGRTATVRVYADAARVELFCDGELIGTKPSRVEHGYEATFEVNYRPGRLTAVTYDAAGREVGRDELSSAADELRLDVQPERDAAAADGSDLIYVGVALTDDEGIVRPLQDRPVTVDVSGAATLLGLGSAAPVTTEQYDTNTHRTYQGRALAVLRCADKPGDITVRVAADGCAPVTKKLAALAAD